MRFPPSPRSLRRPRRLPIVDCGFTGQQFAIRLFQSTISELAMVGIADCRSSTAGFLVQQFVTTLFNRPASAGQSAIGNPIRRTQ
jgi:hypothetical protein